MQGHRDNARCDLEMYGRRWSVLPPLTGPNARVLGSLPVEVSEAIHARAAEAIADFATPNGYVLPGVGVVGVGVHWDIASAHCI